MADPRVEEDEAVEVRVIRVELLRFVQSVEIIDIGADFEFVLDEFEDGAEGVGRCAFGEREFGVTVEHGFGADED